ncbi:nucleotidyltransferase family protein [Halorarius litoreus]|uniref:nucleotidyltransferase family protein n=1 Tax=Halorarius litoreus TaxID=2962676 RepID=UPI0020CC6EAB|nr:nucleotidyltransferase family protein [Halorarius litoreus]
MYDPQDITVIDLDADADRDAHIEAGADRNAGHDAARTDDPEIHGVVLAAGTSSRYGDDNKLLAELDGRPLVYHAASTLLDADLAGVTVVVGHEADRVRDALAELDVIVRTNERYAEGQSTSVATGVAAAAERDADAVVLSLGDMPTVDAATVDRLIRAYKLGVGTVIAAAYDGTRGNPTLFDRSYFDVLLDIDGDVGGREIFHTDDRAVAVETGDPGVRYDVDLPEDL